MIPRNQLSISKYIYTIISDFALQPGRAAAEKDNFCGELHPVIAEIPKSVFLILSNDCNVHVGNSVLDMRERVRDVKVIPGQGIAKQYLLLACEFRADIPPHAKKKSVPHLRTWRLWEPEAQSEYQNAFITVTTSAVLVAVEQKRYGVSWSPVYRRQLKRVWSTKNTGGEKRSGGGM